MVRNKNKKIVWIVLVVLMAVTVLALAIVRDLAESQHLEVVFFDVGQGDAIFIETPDGFQVLIDGGPDLTVLEKLGQEMPFYDRTLDLIILTHPDHDHLFGLLEVLKRYKVKNILWTGVVKDTAEWVEWDKLIREEGAEIIIAQSGQRINLQRPDLYMFILHPFETLEGLQVRDSNDSSIVVQLVFNDISFLFTGDISSKVEQELVAQGLNLEAEVLKAAHHGSKTSSCLEFIEAVSPEVAVISVGENPYGHPNQEVLANLQQLNIEILITKELGDIKIKI